VTLLSLYRRWHLLPDGRVVVTGTNAQGLFLETAGAGTWAPAPSRTMLARDYAPSVMYDVGKVVYIGGGNDPDTAALPADAVEVIDFTDAEPRWRKTTSMHFRRRYHNGTLLPDGTVLVTGGTQGTGFNDLDAGQPIHAAELWNPSTEQWTLLAAEAVDRCYHGTAVLLPDATVLSAGGGEGVRSEHVPPRGADIPPTLPFSRRPSGNRIDARARRIRRGVLSRRVAQHIDMVSWIKLPSVTHAFNQNQRINFLRFTFLEEVLKVLAPDRAELCPPGHYMLFVLDEDGVPSKAKIVHIGAFAPAERETTERTQAVAPLRDRQAEIKKANTGTRVTIGLTSTCPYGLGACWGGAYEALKKLGGVAAVQPIPNAEDSTADVYLDNQGLPDVDLWPEQFARTANGSYDFRGVEVTLTGQIRELDGALQIQVASSGALVLLRPLGPAAKIQWDRDAKRPKRAARGELHAYAGLETEYRNGGPDRQVRVIGPLIKANGQWVLHVRKFAR
jgi:galactose oxidase